jgi:hypothetical protein
MGTALFFVNRNIYCLLHPKEDEPPGPVSELNFANQAIISILYLTVLVTFGPKHSLVNNPIDNNPLNPTKSSRED